MEQNFQWTNIVKWLILTGFYKYLHGKLVVCIVVTFPVYKGSSNQYPIRFFLDP